VTGSVRQLLCRRCNHGLGLFRDDPVLLHAAAYYVGMHRARQGIVSTQGATDQRPEGSSRPGEPPVGSQRRPGGGRGPRSTGRSSGERRQGAAGEAGA
jgi:hypothetical protein